MPAGTSRTAIPQPPPTRLSAARTRSACGAVCLSLLDAPYHEEDGSLNDCLACDEAESGPVFKAVAGRTRRNTGLANALCRPCEEVWRIDHAPLLAALP